MRTIRIDVQGLSFGWGGHRRRGRQCTGSLATAPLRINGVGGPGVFRRDLGGQLARTPRGVPREACIRRVAPTERLLAAKILLSYFCMVLLSRHSDC